MYYGNINLNVIPEIGFAHKHYSTNYKTSYGSNRRMCIEIDYINSGALKVELYGKEMIAEQGSVIVLFRRLPITMVNVDDKHQDHCAVLAEFPDYDFSLLEDVEESQGFVIPFVTAACRECEEIGKRLYKIASEKANADENNGLSLSVEFLSILKELHEINKKNRIQNKSYKVISDKVCAYIDENIEKNISMSEIAEHIGKSPNHIGYAFRSEKGITITEYANIQKIKLIKSLMQEGKSFKEACITAGLCDEAYGYRLFKRYTGITPKEYMRITTIKK